jgi:hypothetical protein
MSIWDWLFTNQPAWVGNVANLTSITVLGAVIGLYRRLLCDQPKCYRLGLHKVEGTTYRTCAKHTTAVYHKLLQ